MVYNIHRCCSSTAGDALQKASSCPPSAPGGSYTLSWAWICVLLIFWYLSSSSCPTSAVLPSPKSRWRLPKYHDIVHKPQLWTSAFLRVTCSRQMLQYQWIILQLRTVQACLDRMGHRTLPDAIVEEINQSQLTLCSHSSCLDIDQTCTMPPCPKTFLPPQNHSCLLDLVSFTTIFWALTSSFLPDGEHSHPSHE